MAYQTRIAWRTVLVVGLLTGPALGEQFPFTGVTTGENVNLRAGAGENYYAVTQLDEGALVRVHGNLYGWYEIEPPAGTFSYVAKRFVKVEGDGSEGVIREDRVRVRAPSPGGPDKSYRRQLLVNEGDRVKVLGEAEGFYKIEPPAEARLFVDERFVEKATEKQIAAAGSEPGRSSGGSSSGGNGSAAEAEPAEKQASPSQQDDGGDASGESSGEAASEASSDSSGEDGSQAKMKKEQGAEASSASSESDGGSDSQDAGEATADASEKDKKSEDADEKSEAEPTEQADAEGEESGADQASSEAEMKAEKAKTDGGENSDSDGPKQADGQSGPSGDDAAASKSEPKRAALPDPAEVALEELSVRPSNDRLTQLERQYLAVSRRSLKDQPIGRLRMAYEKVLSEADLSRSDQALAEARIEGLKTRQELQASLAEISMTQRELTEAEQKREAEDAKKPPEYVAVGRLTTSTLYTGENQPLLYRVVNPLTQRTSAYVRPGGEEGPDVREMLGEYVGIEGEARYDQALKLHVIDPENIDELSASERPARGSAGATP